MNAPDHDLDEPQLQDINAWRRVRLGLTCTRRALIGLLWFPLLTPLLLFVARCVEEAGILAGRPFEYLPRQVLGFCLLALAALYFSGLALFCTAPGGFTVRRHALAAIVLALVACLTYPLLIFVQNGQVC